MHKSYIWSDDIQFKQNMLQINNLETTSDSQCISNNIRHIVNAYFKTIIFQCQEIVPKMLMYYLISVFDDDNVKTSIYETIINNYDFEKLFSISEKQQHKKDELIQKKDRLEKSKKLIAHFLNEP